MSAEDLCSTLVGWFRNRPEDVLDEIARQSNVRLPGMRRMDPVEDATLRMGVPMAAQRLVRWSTVGPEEVFRYGFQPRVFPRANGFTPGAYNLRTYVEQNHDSIFVSTTQPYRNDDGRLVRWERRVSSAIWQRFEYEIFAYGGIDVNRALGVHPFDNQHEVAFAGGIRPEMIRSAREYAGTQIIRIWENTHFDNTLNPPGQNPPLGELPRLRHTPSDAQVRQFPGPDDAPVASGPDHDELRRRRSVDKEISDDDDVAMFPGNDGSGVEDTFMDTTPVPRSRFTCVSSPADKNQAYFFCGNRYALINVNPGAGDTLASGPRNIIADWPSLWKAGFSGGVDAVLRNPDNENEMYFFCVEKYVRIHVTPGATDDYIVSGPRNIIDGWPSLNKAGFERIDAILPNPSNIHEAYFFSGTKYVLVRYQPGSTSDDSIITGPHAISSTWPSLNKAGFTSVKCVLPNPANKNQAYFFSRDQYAIINIAPGTTDDTIASGPYSVHSLWPSLTKAGFW